LKRLFTEALVFSVSETMKSNTYELGFVHLDDLISHETCDFKRVCQLADQIKKEGHLKNPVLVASLPVDVKRDETSQKGKGKLLVLDGVDRISALRLLGFNDVLVQKVDYMDENVELTSWNHLIFRIKKELLVEKLSKLELEISPCDSDGEKDALEDQRTVSYLLFRDHSGLMIRQKDTWMENRIKNLYGVIAIYRSSWEIYHHGLYADLFSPFYNFENCTAVNILPLFKKEGVLNSVSRGILFPLGVTRFVIPQRVLGLEVSCSVLAANVPLSEKNLFLKELLSYRMKSKKARYYQESVFLFNE
jgi:hypothetical protein